MKKNNQRIYHPAGVRKSTDNIRRMKKIIAKLKGSVISYKDPFKPVGLEDWEAIK